MPRRSRCPTRATSSPGRTLHVAVLDALSSGAALFFRQLSDAVGSTDDGALVAALWDLVWAGRLTNDTLAPLRALVGGGRSTHRLAADAAAAVPVRPSDGPHCPPHRAADRGRPLVAAAGPRPRPDPARPRRRRGAARPARRGHPRCGRRPSACPAASRRSTACCRRSRRPGGRGAATSSPASAPPSSRRPAAVDRLRAVTEHRGAPRAVPALVLAATDPANPYGAALPWPDRTRRRPRRPPAGPQGRRARRARRRRTRRSTSSVAGGAAVLVRRRQQPASRGRRAGPGRPRRSARHAAGRARRRRNGHRHGAGRRACSCRIPRHSARPPPAILTPERRRHEPPKFAGSWSRRGLLHDRASLVRVMEIVRADPCSGSGP